LVTNLFGIFQVAHLGSERAIEQEQAWKSDILLLLLQLLNHLAVKDFCLDAEEDEVIATTIGVWLSED
tara:strand:+ start:203 stop:406 length:204 start_codon:yes stop_codon:yes gene_type:complete